MIVRSWKRPWVSRSGIEKIPQPGAVGPCGQVLQKSAEYGRSAVLAAKIIGAALLVSMVALELKTSWLQSHVFSAIDRRLTYTMRLAVIFRSVRPQEGRDRFAAFLRMYPGGSGVDRRGDRRVV